MKWEDELKKKFVKSESNPDQDNYGETYLDGDILELETFIKSLLKKQRERCSDEVFKWLESDMREGTYEEIIENSPEPKGVKTGTEIKALIDKMIEYYQKLRKKDADDGDTEGIIVCNAKIQVLFELKEKI